MTVIWSESRATAIETAMDVADYVRAFGALAFVLALAFGAAFALRVLRGRSFAATSGGSRRMQVVESMALDMRRRLVLVRCDQSEFLIVLGPDRETVLSGPNRALDPNEPSAATE